MEYLSNQRKVGADPVVFYEICREFLIIDPDGYLLRFAQDIGVEGKLS